MSTFNTYVYLLDREGEDHEVKCSVDYDAFYQPARISGPPEDCYPEDGEMTINEVVPYGDLPGGLNDDDFKAALETQMDDIEEAAWEDYHRGGDE